MASDWPTVRDRIEARTDRVVADLRDRWPDARTPEPFSYGPQPFHPDDPPETVDGQRDLVAGIASVVVFYTDAREETVLVYNWAGGWEPPGGVVEADQTPEEAAVAEAREETGLRVELTDCYYAGRFEFRYANGASVRLPRALFVGRRVDGRLAVERERIDHPGAARATGLFDAETLPETRHSHEEIRQLIRTG